MKLKYAIKIKSAGYLAPIYHELETCDHSECGKILNRNSTRIARVQDLRPPRPCPLPSEPIISLRNGFVLVDVSTQKVLSRLFDSREVNFEEKFFGYFRMELRTQFRLRENAYRNFKKCDNGHVIQPLLLRPHLDLIECDPDCELAICSSFFGAFHSLPKILCSERIAEKLYASASVLSSAWVPSEKSGLIPKDLPNPYNPSAWK